MGTSFVIVLGVGDCHADCDSIGSVAEKQSTCRRDRFAAGRSDADDSQFGTARTVDSAGWDRQRPSFDCPGRLRHYADLSKYLFWLAQRWSKSWRSRDGIWPFALEKADAAGIAHGAARDLIWNSHLVGHDYRNGYSCCFDWCRWAGNLHYAGDQSKQQRLSDHWGGTVSIVGAFDVGTAKICRCF